MSSSFSTMHSSLSCGENFYSAPPTEYIQMKMSVCVYRERKYVCMYLSTIISGQNFTKFFCIIVIFIYLYVFVLPTLWRMSRLHTMARNRQHIIYKVITRDQPNSRFHGRDIFREIGLLPWKTLISGKSVIFLWILTLYFHLWRFQSFRAAFVRILLFTTCHTWALNSWHVFTVLLTYIPPH